MDYIALGNQIRKSRQSKNYTQKQLAEKIGVSSSYIGLIESGKRKIAIDTLILISNELNCSTNNLLQDSLTSVLDTNKTQYDAEQGKGNAINEISQFILDRIKSRSMNKKNDD